MRLLLGAAVVAVSLAGCGTTVPLASQAQSPDGLSVQGGQAGEGRSLTPEARPTPGTASGGRPGSGPLTLPGAGRVSPGAAGTGAPPGRGGVPLASGRGFTAKEIRIGFSISSDASAGLGGLGLGVAVADQRELVRTWVTKVNAEGGIAGRTVVPVFFDYSTTGNLTTQDQAACATWTQDTPVFAATGVRAGISGSGDNLTPCLAKAGVPWLAGAGDVHKWRQYLPAMYSTSDLNLTRATAVHVEALAAQGFFTKGAKIGVVINDNQADNSRAVREGMEPALKERGLSITRRVVISNAQTESTNAELQMFSAGVTHVLFAAPGGAAAAQFMIAADQQRRTYAYGISSQDAPGLTVQVLAPRSQLVHARGYGIRPGLDVDSNNQPPETPGMKACFDLYRKKGYDTGSLNRAAMAMICDGLNLLQAALRGHTTPTQGGLAEAVAAFGTRLPVASTFSSEFSATQHDGVGSYRFLRYVEDCSCFRYQGGLRRAR